LALASRCRLEGAGNGGRVASRKQYGEGPLATASGIGGERNLFPGRRWGGDSRRRRTSRGETGTGGFGPRARWDGALQKPFARGIRLGGELRTSAVRGRNRAQGAQASSLLRLFCRAFGAWTVLPTSRCAPARPEGLSSPKPDLRQIKSTPFQRLGRGLEAPAASQVAEAGWGGPYRAAARAQNMLGPWAHGKNPLTGAVI